MSETIYSALMKAQKAMPELTFDSTNPHFGNNYLSLKGLLTQVLPILQAEDLLLLQTPSNIGSEAVGYAPALRTQLLHVPTNEAIVDLMPLQATKTDPQAQGSAITYARRYALMTLLGLVADEDDDGNAASGGAPSNTTTKSTLKDGSSRSGRKKQSVASTAPMPAVKF